MTGGCPLGLELLAPDRLEILQHLEACGKAAGPRHGRLGLRCFHQLKKFAGQMGEVDATLADGTPAILKLLLPHIAGKDGNEAEVLRLANGEGCALLYRHDEARGAMLMERLGPTLADSGLSPREKLAVLFETAQTLWRHTPPEGLQTSAEKGRWLIAFIR